MRTSVVPSRAGVGRAAGGRGGGRDRSAPGDEAVQILVGDPTRRAGAGHEGQVHAQIAGAVAHGGRGGRALAGRAAGQGGGDRQGSYTMPCGRGPPARFTGRRRSGDRLLPARSGGRWRGAQGRDGGALSDIAPALDVERHQRAADGHLLTRFAIQGGDGSGDGRGDLHRGLVGHDVGDDLVFLDRVADLDVPADQLGLGRALAHVGQFEDVVARRWRSVGEPLHRCAVPLPADVGRRRFTDGLLPARGGARRLGAQRRDGGVLFGISGPLDLELDQGAAHRHHGARLAVEGDDLARDRGGDLDGGLVGHDVGDDLVLGDGVADLDVPTDQFGLGGAFAHVGQFEDETTHVSDLPS